MSSEAKEHVQTMVWIIEGATFLTTALIVWIVWRVTRRARKDRKPEQSD